MLPVQAHLCHALSVLNMTFTSFCVSQNFFVLTRLVKDSSLTEVTDYGV